jgi:type III secretory pathway lipoprotein EscJ
MSIDDKDFEPHYDQDRDRRLATQIAVAVNAEKLQNLTIAVQEIKMMLQDHISDESRTFDKIHNRLDEVQETIEKKISASVGPIQADVQKYKTILGVVITVGGVVFTVLLTFRDAILKLFGFHI